MSGAQEGGDRGWDEGRERGRSGQQVTTSRGGRSSQASGLMQAQVNVCSMADPGVDTKRRLMNDELIDRLSMAAMMSGEVFEKSRANLVARP